MAITALSTLSTSSFKGGAHLAGSNATSLVGRLNTVIAKINQVISGISDGSLDALVVGSVGGGSYYGSSNSWFSVDGTNPPTMSRFRMLDETTGLYVTWRTNNGVLASV
jgi:hypothetical protein